MLPRHRRRLQDSSDPARPSLSAHSRSNHRGETESRGGPLRVCKRKGFVAGLGSENIGTEPCIDSPPPRLRKRAWSDGRAYRCSHNLPASDDPSRWKLLPSPACPTGANGSQGKSYPNGDCRSSGADLALYAQPSFLDRSPAACLHRVSGHFNSSCFSLHIRWRSLVLSSSRSKGSQAARNGRP